MGGDRRAVRGRGARPHAPTFEVAGHHYALVHVADLEPGQRRPVRGRPRRRGRSGPSRTRTSPPSVIRTLDPERPCGRVRLLPRRGAARAPVHAQQGRGRRAAGGRRALRAGAADARAAVGGVAGPAAAPRRPGLRRRGVARGDASYIAARRTAPPPGEQVADFEEYTRLYWESWGDPDDPLAALDRLDRDDLRRPRRPRRLEHLARRGSTTCARAAVVARAHHRRASCRTGSTSTSATSRPTSSQADAMYAGVQRPRTARPMLRRVRRPRRPRGRGHALELLPRLRRHARGRHRLARRPRARGRPAAR